MVFYIFRRANKSDVRFVAIVFYAFSVGQVAHRKERVKAEENPTKYDIVSPKFVNKVVFL